MGIELLEDELQQAWVEHCHQFVDEITELDVILE